MFCTLDDFAVSNGYIIYANNIGQIKYLLFIKFLVKGVTFNIKRVRIPGPDSIDYKVFHLKPL